MKLHRRIADRLTPDLVERINEIYHDLEGGRYNSRHEEMQADESGFWRSIAPQYLAQDEPVVCFDFGTGTGLVPWAVGNNLKPKDRLICGDISAEMLRQCERRLKQRSLQCSVTFLKSTARRIPLPDRSVDVITANAVLHHVLDLEHLAAEFTRILKPGGVVIANHEPHASPDLGKPSNIFFTMAEISPLLERVMRRLLSQLSPRYRTRNRMLAEIARRVRREGLLDFDLRGTEVQQVVDIHTQTGFTRNDISSSYFPQFEILLFETYDKDRAVRFILSPKPDRSGNRRATATGWLDSAARGG